MKKVSRLALVTLLALSLVLTIPAWASWHGGSPGGEQPTPEAEGSCFVVGTGRVGSAAGKLSCSYLSRGPGEFAGQASAGWCIRHWRAGSLQVQICHAFYAYTGELSTQDGDVVEVILAEKCLEELIYLYGCSAGIYPGFVRAGDT